MLAFDTAVRLGGVAQRQDLDRGRFHFASGAERGQFLQMLRQASNRVHIGQDAHPARGAQLLDEFIERLGEDSFLNTAKDIILYHHEQWNGGGYPDALHGDAIPLAARITALADVYDALTSRRVYKQAIAHDVALTIMHEERGRHFDPDILDSMLEIAPQFEDISRCFADSPAEH